jgi:amino acid transporter
MLKRIGEFMLGKSKDPLDASTFHQLALVAFLAWVGLGADGLSSSSYGPEEAFRALGEGHGHLALYLAVATAITVLIISFSYNQIIEMFPHGGGGYAVVSQLMGPFSGLVCGAALVVDYVLTISISIAAGGDAVFSFLPVEWAGQKVLVASLFIGLLIWMNMRGVKESIKVLTPIFLVFVFTHFALIVYGIFSHGSELPGIVHGAVNETQAMVQSEAGWWGLIALLLTAYSLGGGTYTGIEAVANGMNTLAEPKVRTGKRTMVYMALSLAFTAAGILICYMLWNVTHVPGKTMNAVLTEAVFGQWVVMGIPVGKGLVYVTLVSEGLLLFVAAQAGFIAGPTVLSNMAVDSWMPHRFANLSVRLVRQNGVLVMGIAALLILWYTKGKVSTLVVLYSINVFITFTLSQYAMAKHWWAVRAERKDWMPRFAINAVGTALTSVILVSTTIIKFSHGGWVTLVITGAFIGFCMLIHRHYDNVKLALRRLDDLLINLPIPEMAPEYVPPKPEGPTAVLLVNGYGGLGIHAIFSIRKLFRSQEFKNFLFVSVGQIDSARFKGVEELEHFKRKMEEDLARYVDLAQRMGYYSEYRYAMGTDRVSELEKICTTIADDFVEPVFFCGKLVFAREDNFTKMLHNQTAMEIQRRLMFAGLNTIVVPVRVL